PGTILNSRSFSTSISVSAPRGVSEVTYKINTEVIAVEKSPPFNISFTAANLESGNHTLTISVTDDIGNRIEENIPFTLDAEPLAPGVNFVERAMSVPKNGFPVGILLSHRKLDDLKKVTVFYQTNESDERKNIIEITDFENTTFFNNKISIVWYEAPEPGNYRLTAEITSRNDVTTISDEIRVQVKN
ncbi:MAG: hypothetical protein KBD29_04405, partial [Candidatus Magasanikbacteria bacterium]|nr:hypothetical protein [Candidatus Magasanikbacteria bacterium]